MRIDRLDLLAYGQFTGRSLDLSNGDQGLHLIYGDNEAGKSTSLRALIALLFGIPTRTDDNFFHSNPQLRVGGKLTLSDGRSVEFVRRKGTKGTILDHRTDNALEDSILNPFLPGNIDESLFKKLYGLDHSRLVAGGQELLNQSGDIGQALFSAAVGTEGLRDILLELQNGAEELFKPKASKKVVNQAISHFKQAQKRIRESSLPVSQWKRLQADHANVLSEIEKVENEIVCKNKEKSRLARLTRVVGVLAERRSLLGRISALGETVVLPEDFNEQRKNGNNRYQLARETKEKAEAKLSRLERESAVIHIRQELLDNEETIIALHKELGAVEKTIQDRPQQDGKRRLLRNEAKTLLKGVRPDLELQNADQLRPLLTQRKWLLSLAQEYGLLNQRSEELHAGSRDLQAEQISLRTELGEQPTSHPDLGEFKAVISTVRKSGDIEQRMAELQKRYREERALCKLELERLGRYAGTVEELMEVAMPVSETLDLFERRIDEYTENKRDYERRIQTVRDELERAEQALKTLLLTSDIPTISELEEIRISRDNGWNLIKCKYIEDKDVDDDIDTYTSGVDLSLIYEEKIEAADSLADQLRMAADQVVKRADLETTIEHLQARLNALLKQTQEATRTLDGFYKKWRGEWEPLGIDPGSPREMKQWLLRVDKLLAHAHTARMVSIDEQKLSEKCKELKDSISLQLRAVSENKRREETSLEAMLTLCEQFLEAEEQVLQRQRALEHSLNETEVRIERVMSELKIVEREKANWAKEWGQAIEGLGVPSSAHPERAIGAIEQLVLFFDTFDKSEDLRKRIYGMDQVEEKFVNRVCALADTIGYAREGRDAAALAVELNKELSEARELRASLDKLVTQQGELAGDIEDATIAIKLAQDQLASLRAQAQAKTDDDLILLCERSDTKRELQSTLDRLEQELTRTGDGLSIADLEREAMEGDIDSVDGQQQKITLELTELHAKRDELRDQRQTLQNEMDSKDGNVLAAEASEELEQYRAGIISGTEQYLRLKIAALILEQQIEHYRRENQAPVLARAGVLFSKFTLGSYSQLRDELDDTGKPILLGVRPNDSEVTVEGMSDGTRDQLYLALRLATLELYLSKGEPLPFIVDDILIAFDDSRTRVCLEVLSELSATTQVLLFTHHRRVLELADRRGMGQRIYIHEL